MSAWISVFATQAVPVNMLNAMPLLTTSQFTGADGADGLVMGAHVMKYWSPAVLGMGTDVSGVPFDVITAPGADPAKNKKYCLTSPWLAVTPCVFFVFTILRYFPNPAENFIGTGLVIGVQFKQTPAELPNATNSDGTVFEAVADKFNGINYLCTGPLIFPAPNIANNGTVPQRISVQVSPNSPIGGSQLNTNLAMGPSVRFQLIDTAAPAAGDNSTYSMSIYGQSS